MFNQNCIKKNKAKRIKKLIIWLSIIVIIFIAILCYFNSYVNPIIIKSNNAVIKQKTVSVINNCVDSVFSSNSYDDLITINYDSENNVTSITANTVKVNDLKTALVKSCEQNLSDITLLSFAVPLGTFTGIPIFNGLGPNITLKMVPIGSVDSSYSSYITSAGINQTRHQIFINIDANVSVLLPGNNSSVNVSTQVLVAESLIVGNVPQVYFGSNNNLNSLLNLNP